MKRPQGFDPPRSDLPAKLPPARKSRATQKPKSGRKTAAPTAAPTAAHPRAKIRATQREKTARTDLVPPRGTPLDAESAEPRAGRQLRRTARARRRFEKSEIRRFTRRTRHRRIAWLVVLATVVSMAALVAVGVYSPLLALKTITINGASRVNASEVHTAVDGQLGTPLALVDFGKVRRELAAFPLIRSFVTEIVPPDTLIIHIVERAPVGSLATATGFDVVDPAGIVIQASAQRQPGVPLIDLGGATASSPAFAAAVAVLLALPDSLLPQVDRVTARTRDDVTFVLTGAGQRVVWGSPDQSDLKARVLQRLIATQNPASRVEYDVSAPLSAVVRPG